MRKKRFIAENSPSSIRIIEGRNPVREALRAKNPISRIYLEMGIKMDARLLEIQELAGKNGVAIERVLSKRLRKMSKTDGHHQGVIAYAEPFEEKNLPTIYEEIIAKKEKPLFLVLAGVLYEHNLGAVLRTAEAAGVHAVIIPNRSLELTPVVSRSAMGAEEHIPLIHENLFVAMKFFKEEDIKVVGASEKSGKSMYEADLNRGLALVIGTEDSGISETLEKHIHEFITIPMLGRIGSLNMSVAAAICLYEVVRQRRYGGKKENA